MEALKTTSNLEFELIYADGTRQRVPEGILWSVENEVISVHFGTSRLAVLFACIADALSIVDRIGCTKLLFDYLTEGPESHAFRQLLKIAGNHKLATFQLVQMDMRESVVAMLRDRATVSASIIRATLEAAAAEISNMGVME